MISEYKSPEYNTWINIKTRCYNKNYKDYPNYGGRGIKVCDRWLNSFFDFLADMGNRPSNKHSIERECNDGDYCPENCSWSTRKEQNRNSRHNVLVTYKGVTQCFSAWCEQLGLEYHKCRARIRIGWTDLQALELVPRK